MQLIKLDDVLTPKLSPLKNLTLKSLLDELRQEAFVGEYNHYNSSIVDCCTFLIEVLEGQHG